MSVLFLSFEYRAYRSQYSAFLAKITRQAAFWPDLRRLCWQSHHYWPDLRRICWQSHHYQPDLRRLCWQSHHYRPDLRSCLLYTSDAADEALSVVCFVFRRKDCQQTLLRSGRSWWDCQQTLLRSGR